MHEYGTFLFQGSRNYSDDGSTKIFEKLKMHEYGTFLFQLDKCEVFTCKFNCVPISAIVCSFVQLYAYHDLQVHALIFGCRLRAAAQP